MRTDLSLRGDCTSPLYYDMSATLERGYYFNFIIGGRGIGKTFSFFKSALDRGAHFMYLRYSVPEYERSINPDTSPIIEHLDPFDADVSTGASAIYDAERVDGKVIRLEKVGYCGSLTNFKNARGTRFDYKDGDLCLFDEFIPESGARRLIKDPFTAWANFHETAFRRKKVQTVFCSNADTLSSPILAGLDLIRPIEYMIDHDLTSWADDERSIFIELPADVPISAEKSKDPLYRLMHGTDFSAVALKNQWAMDDRHDVRVRKLVEYTPLAMLQDGGFIVSIWQHKGGRGIYYCRTRAEVPTLTRKQFRTVYQLLHRQAVFSDRAYYYDYHTKLHVTEVMR